MFSEVTAAHGVEVREADDDELPDNGEEYQPCWLQPPARWNGDL